MMEQVSHNHFMHIFTPQRTDNINHPFYLPNNRYTNQLGLTVLNYPSENAITIGQIPQNFLNEWQFTISDHLPVADPTAQYVGQTIFPPEVPPLIDVHK